MTAPGEPIHAADYACTWRAMEPRPDAPRGLLVLLHGADGDELQFADVAARAPAGLLVALPRGHRSIGGGRIGWWRVGLAEDGPQVVEDEAEDARTRMVEFVAQLQQRFDVPPSRTLLAGFSQGGVLAASVALTAPSRVAGFAMVSGRLLPEVAPCIAPPGELAHLQVLLVHGRDDTTLPVDESRRAKAELERLGLAPALRLHDAAHAFEPAMAEDVVQWVHRVAAAFAQPEAPGADTRGP